MSLNFNTDWVIHYPDAIRQGNKSQSEAEIVFE